jgi:DNA-binding GntR family transcriptional regulator
MLEGLYRIMHAFRELGFANQEIREAAAEEHFALVDAIAARDRERSAKLLGDHIAKSKSRILAEVLRSGL